MKKVLILAGIHGDEIPAILAAYELQELLRHNSNVVVIPRVNKILAELGREQTDVLALGWEVLTAKESLKPAQLILTSLTPTRHWLPILAIAGLLGSYSVITKSNNQHPDIS